MFYNFIKISNSQFSPLELLILHFWLQIRILHVKNLPGDTRTPLETDLHPLKRDIEGLRGVIFQNFEILKFHVFLSVSLNFTILTAKTASPGPVVPVPILGSWEYADFS